MGDSPLASSCYSSDVENKDLESIQRFSTNYDDRAFGNFGNIFSDVLLYTGQESTFSTRSVSTSNSLSSGSADTSNGGIPGVGIGVKTDRVGTVLYPTLIYFIGYRIGYGKTKIRTDNPNGYGY